MCRRVRLATHPRIEPPAALSDEGARAPLPAACARLVPIIVCAGQNGKRWKIGDGQETAEGMEGTLHHHGAWFLQQHVAVGWPWRVEVRKVRIEETTGRGHTASPFEGNGHSTYTAFPLISYHFISTKISTLLDVQEIILARHPTRRILSPNLVIVSLVRLKCGSNVGPKSENIIFILDSSRLARLKNAIHRLFCVRLNPKFGMHVFSLTRKSPQSGLRLELPENIRTM